MTRHPVNAIQAVVLCGLLSLGLCVCQGESSGDGWPIEGGGDASSPDVTVDVGTDAEIGDGWTRMNGILGGRFSAKIDGKLYFGREYVSTMLGVGIPANYVSTDGDRWEPVGSEGLEGLVAGSVMQSYAETEDARYLMRETREWEASQESVTFELYRAPRGSEDFQLVDTEQFRGEPTLLAVGARLFAFLGRLSDNSAKLLRWQDRSNGGWQDVSGVPSETVLGEPFAYDGKVLLTGRDSELEPFLYRYEPNDGSWASEALPRTYELDDGTAFQVTGRLVVMHVPRTGYSVADFEGEPRRVRYLSIGSEGFREVELDNEVPLSFSGFASSKNEIYGLGARGRLFRTDLEAGRVREVLSKRFPVRSGGYKSLRAVGDGFVAKGAERTHFEWSFGETDWERTGPVRVTPRRGSMSFRDDELWSSYVSGTLRHRGNTGEWEVIYPFVGSRPWVWRADGRTISYSSRTGCLFEKTDDGWVFRFQFTAEDQIRTGSCEGELTDEIILGDIASFDGGLVLNILQDSTGIQRARIVKVQSDSPSMTRLDTEREAIKVYRSSLEVYGDELWVSATGPRPASEDEFVVSRFDGEGGVTDVSGAVVDSSGNEVEFRGLEFAPAPIGAETVFARVGLTSSGESLGTKERLARWSYSEQQFRLLPYPGESDENTLRREVVTRAGAIAVTEGKIFRWRGRAGKWQELSIEPPELDGEIDAVAANSNRMVVGVDNRRLWQRSVSWTK